MVNMDSVLGRVLLSILGEQEGHHLMHVPDFTHTCVFSTYMSGENFYFQDVEKDGF